MVELQPRQGLNEYLKLIRQQDLSDARIAQIQIPVAHASHCDPGFRPASENQIINQLVQNRRYDANNVQDSMNHLCKKLAKKRVFGPRFMTQMAQAGLNQSNYSNLPMEGIIYIQNVCRRVMGDRFTTDADFWAAFRKSMKKIICTCTSFCVQVGSAHGCWQLAAIVAPLLRNEGNQVFELGLQ